MVRFKLPDEQEYARLKSMFQFHDGSIQAFEVSHVRAEQITFQFHDGSIQARIKT